MKTITNGTKRTIKIRTVFVPGETLEVSDGLAAQLLAARQGLSEVETSKKGKPKKGKKVDDPGDPKGDDPKGDE